VAEKWRAAASDAVLLLGRLLAAAVKRRRMADLSIRNTNIIRHTRITSMQLLNLHFVY